MNVTSEATKEVMSIFRNLTQSVTDRQTSDKQTEGQFDHYMPSFGGIKKVNPEMQNKSQTRERTPYLILEMHVM
jgi:hypothetical protein